MTIVYTIISQKFLDYLRTCVILWKDDLSQLDLSRVLAFDSKIRFHPMEINHNRIFVNGTSEKLKLKFLFIRERQAFFLGSFNRNNHSLKLLELFVLLFPLQSPSIEGEWESQLYEILVKFLKRIGIADIEQGVLRNTSRSGEERLKLKIKILRTFSMNYIFVEFEYIYFHSWFELHPWNVDFIVLFDSKKIFHFDQQRIFVLSFFNKRWHSVVRENLISDTRQEEKRLLISITFFFFFSFFFFFLSSIFPTSDASAKFSVERGSGSGRGRIHERNISIISRFVILDSYMIYVVFSITCLSEKSCMLLVQKISPEKLESRFSRNWRKTCHSLWST